MKRFRKSAIALVLALLMALQGTEPIFVQAKEAIEDVQKNADFSRPEALTEEEAGITDSTSGEQDKSQQSDADVQNETTPSEDTETQEEQTTPAEETEENPQEKEVELKEPQDYYPIPEEPEGELIDYDAISKTYKTGDKQYTTVYGGYVGTYKNEDGDTELVDNTLVKPEEADTPASEEAQEASSVVATEEKEEKTEVYQNKANDYAILLPEQMSEENGVTIENGKTRIGIIPVDGDYTHSVIKDNAILYNEVYEGADVQYTVLDSSIKEDIVLQQPTDREVYEYELQIPGYQAEVKDNQVYIYPEGKTIKDAKYLLETPSMEDAAGEISFLITLELREEDGKTILTVKPDRDWLSAEERQYPVRIDPTPVEIQKSSFNMIGVEEGSPTSQIGDNNYPYVGFDDGIKSGNLAGFGTAHQNCRTYIKVNSNFSQIPKDSKIDSATFAVSQKTAYSGGASQFGLYRVDQSWNTSITWKTKPVNLTFQDVQNASTSRNSYINYDVKDLVNDWVQGTHANNGFALVAIAEANNLGASMQCEVLNNRASVYGPKLSIQWSPAEDPYLRDMSLDETTILLRPMTEKNTNGKLKFDAVFADGIAKSKSTVEYYLLPDEENEEHHETDAKPLYSYPDSTEYNKQFPEANKYYSKDSNWQSALYSGLTKDKLYKIKAKASKEIDGKLETGKEVTSDSFVIYEVKQFDTFPKIAKYYGVPLKNIMKDNQVMDALVVANNTIFIRNPQTNVPYSPAPLTDQDKMRIDGALMGRGLHCEFGFEPVNLNTGNFYMDQSDATMNELNGEFSITRSYNSKGTDQHSMFGRGWSFNYDQSLSQMEDGSLLYMRGDGSYLIFDKNEDGSYTAPDGYVYDLKAVSYKDTDHDYIGWELTDADQSVWSFDKYGILRYVTDVNGFKTVLDYDDDYNLSKITTPSGKTFGVKQDKFGHIKELSLPDGGKVSYKYDEQGNLISVTDPNGTTKEYKYDDDSRMTSWKDENGNTVVKNTYDKEGRVVEQTDAEKGTATFKYGKSSTTTTDNEGNKTVYHYDDQYRTTSIEYPDGTTCEKTYNAENQLASETTAAGTKTYTYDTFGNVATETREDGKTASYTYNEQNKLTSATGYNGATVTYSYDGNGNMVTSTKPDGTAITYTYDDKHRMVSQTDGRGVTTTYSYDGPNMTGYVDGNGAAWGFTYDAMNRAVTMTDPLGNVTSNSYDANGNLTSKTAADGGVTAYTLDGVGNITASTDALGNTTTYTYDKMYNMTSGTDPKGNQISYVYDKNYQQVKATDAKGNTITYKYDSMGRVIEESNKDFGTKLYEYDKAGNLKKYTDGNGNATVSKFDSLGQVLQSKDAVGNITKYEYDALGNETKITYFVCDERLEHRIVAIEEKNKNALQKEALLSLKEHYDMDEVSNLSGFDRRMVSVPKFCSGDCPKRGSCRYQQYLERSRDHEMFIQICNHNYLLADGYHRLQDYRPLLKDYRALIVDEAHKLPDAAKQMFGKSLCYDDIREICFYLGNEYQGPEIRKLSGTIRMVLDIIGENHRTRYGIKEEFHMTEECAMYLYEGIQTMNKIIEKLEKKIPKWIRNKLEETKSVLECFFHQDKKYVLHLKQDHDHRIILCASSRRIPQYLDQMLWSRGMGAILTSGTLKTGQGFSHIRKMTGLQRVRRVREYVADSPFEYQKNCLLYLPKNLKTCRRESQEEAEMIAGHIHSLICSTYGHTLVLFTSYHLMGNVYQMLRDEIPFPMIEVWRHSPEEITRFKQMDNAVLFAAGSCWEGVDFPGDMVSSLIIVKLPFAVPDPISEAQKKEYASLKDYIQAVIVPDMQKKLRQGFGRALRTETDTCVVSILDERAGEGGRYHEEVMCALPSCKMAKDIKDVQHFIRNRKGVEYYL